MGCGNSKATSTVPADETTEKEVQNNNPILYVNALSPVARAVNLIAHECGAEINVREVDLQNKENHEEWYLKLNPNHSVPVLKDGETVICESIDIAKYLVEKYCKDGKMYPEDKRDQIDEIIKFTNGETYPLGGKILFGGLFAGKPAPEDAVETAKEHFVKYNTMLGDNDFLAGDCCTIADMFAFSMLANILFDPSIKKPEGLDQLESWSHRIRAKPYFATTHKTFFVIKNAMKAKSNGESEDPTIYMNYASPVSRSVVMIAAYLDIKINLKQLDLFKGEHKKEEYLAINPNGTVPTMVHGDVTICQSRDIGRYLVNTFSKGNALYPEDEEKRKQIDELLAFDDTELFPSVAKVALPAFGGKSIYPEYGDMHAKVLHARDVLGDKEYFTGDSMTIADVFLYNDFFQVAIDPKYTSPPDTDTMHAFMARMTAVTAVGENIKPFIGIKSSVAEKFQES